MAITALADGVKLTRVQIDTPDLLGNYKVTVFGTVRQGYVQFPVMATGADSDVATLVTEAYTNSLIADINDQVDTLFP